MKKQCAWCKDFMDDIPSSQSEDGFISHGLCTKCFAKMTSNISTDPTEFLNSLDEPVVIVNDDVQIQAFNNAAKKLIHKTLRSLKNRYAGDIFECAYAKLPGGCGKTIHCTGCTIRNCVEETYTTGRSINRAKTTLKYSEKEADSAELLISTQKIKGMVVLRIEPAGE